MTIVDEHGVRSEHRRGGRPPLPEGERREVVIHVRVTRDEAETWRAAARVEGVSMSEYARQRACLGVAQARGRWT